MRRLGVDWRPVPRSGRRVRRRIHAQGPRQRNHPGAIALVEHGALDWDCSGGRLTCWRGSPRGDRRPLYGNELHKAAGAGTRTRAGIVSRRSHPFDLPRPVLLRTPEKSTEASRAGRAASYYPRHAMGLDPALPRVGADESGRGSPLATPEQPLSPFTDDPTNGGGRNMRGRERQPLRIRSVELRGPCAAPLLRIVAW